MFRSSYLFLDLRLQIFPGMMTLFGCNFGPTHSDHHQSTLAWDIGRGESCGVFRASRWRRTSGSGSGGGVIGGSGSGTIRGFFHEMAGIGCGRPMRAGSKCKVQIDGSIYEINFKYLSTAQF